MALGEGFFELLYVDDDGGRHIFPAQILPFFYTRVIYTHKILDWFFNLDRSLSFSLPLWTVHKDSHTLNYIAYNRNENDMRFVDTVPNLFENFGCWFFLFPWFVCDLFILCVLEI